MSYERGLDVVGSDTTNPITVDPLSSVDRIDSTKELRLLFDNIMDFAILVMDVEGILTDWNVGGEHILGYSKTEVLGTPASLIFTPEDQAAGVPAVELRTALAEGRAEDERWHLRKDGSRFWASGVMTALFDIQGNHYGFSKILRDLTERKRLEDELRQANELLEARVTERTAQLSQAGEERRELLRQIVQAQETERGRVARELHDDMGQNVTALLLGLSSLANQSDHAPDSPIQETIHKLSALGQEVAEQVHRIAFRLRPTALDDLGLVTALKNHVQDWQGWSNIPVDLEIIGLGSIAEGFVDNTARLPSEIETTIYRVVQEALTNVMRHASEATQVSLLLQRTDGEVRAIIEDDGPGFFLEAVQARPVGKRRMGLVGMRERLELVGGRLDLESEPGQGTTVFLRIPLSSLA